jgi:two-component system cell cycle sensor histidine kinase PleC
MGASRALNRRVPVNVYNPLTLAFRDSALEREFQHDYFEKSLWHARGALVLIIILYGAFGVLDSWIVPDIKEIAWFIRYGVVLPLCAALLAFSFHQAFERWMQPMFAVLYMIGSSGIVLMIALAQRPGSDLYYAGLLLAMMFGFTVMRLQFARAMWTTLVIGALYEASTIWLKDAPLPILVNNNFFFLSGVVLGAIGGYYIELHVRRDFLQRREIEDKGTALEAANRHKSEFLATMSHELRTPLNAIIGFSEVLRERLFGDLNAKQAEYVSDIHASGEHLLSLINDILDLSKVEAGRMELDIARFSVPQALENALILIRERAMRRGVKLDLTVEAGIGEIAGDERKFKQIMLNLLSNAVKFTPEGGRVAVHAARSSAELRIAVSDTGAGISAEDQRVLFEAFQQVGKDSARKAEGTGLGLALTRKFVELHGGAIRVESEPGKGSCFSFSLPAGSADADVDLLPALEVLAEVVPALQAGNPDRGK